MPSTSLQCFLQLQPAIKISLWSPSPDHASKLLLYSSFPSESALMFAQQPHPLSSDQHLFPRPSLSLLLGSFHLWMCTQSGHPKRDNWDCAPQLHIPDWNIFMYILLPFNNYYYYIYVYIVIGTIYIYCNLIKKIFCGPKRWLSGKRIYSVCRRAWIQISSMHTKS